MSETEASQTAVKEQGDAVAPAQASAPEKVQSADGSPKPESQQGTGVEPTPSQPKAGKDSPKSGPEKTAQEKREWFQKRQAEKAQKEAAKQPVDWESRFKSFEERLERLAGTANRPAEAQPASSDLSFLDNPDAWLDQKLTERVQRIEQQQLLQKATDEAGTWLSNRSHIKQDGAFAGEVARMLAEGGRYHALSQVDPVAAAEGAYHAVCRAKGIVPDWESFNPNSSTESAQASQGIAPKNGNLGGGGKTWTGQEVTAYLNAVPGGSKEWFARQAEIDVAAREGRVR